MIQTRTLLDDVSEAPKKQWRQLLLGFAALTLIGPAMLAYGTGGLEMHCEGTSCTVRNTYLFGAAQTVRELHEVTEARVRQYLDDAPRLEFVTRSATYPVSVLMNLDRHARSRLKRNVNAYLASGARAPSFHAVESAYSFFAFAALPGTALWALTLFGLITPTRRDRLRTSARPKTDASGDHLE